MLSSQAYPSFGVTVAVYVPAFVALSVPAVIVALLHVIPTCSSPVYVKFSLTVYVAPLNVQCAYRIVLLCLAVKVVLFVTCVPPSSSVNHPSKV